MNKIKTIFILIFLIFLNGCMQSSAMMGPALTIATTGNIYQTGLSYTTSQLIQHETGKSTFKHFNDFLKNVENKKSEINKVTTLKAKRASEDFFIVVENRIKKTARIIFLEN